MKKLKLLLQYNKLFIILFIFLCGYELYFTRIKTYSSKYSLNDTLVIGKIISYSINGDTLKMNIAAKEMIKTSYYIKSLEEKEFLLENINIGDQVTLEGVMKPVYHNTIPNTFDYQAYLYNKKIYHQFLASQVEITKHSKNIFYNIKNTLIKKIYQREDNEYLLLFLLGDKALVDNTEYTGFQINGTAHLLAISGMHIGILLKGLELILKKLKPNKKSIIISLCLFFFAFLTGFSASVSRVICFYILSTLNKIKDLNFSNLQILFFTVFVLCLINPFIIFDYGFLYSVIITAGIIYYSNKIKGNFFICLLKVSWISFLFSLPLTSNINYEINIISVLSNLIFVPLVTYLVYPLALITFVIKNPLWKVIIQFFVFLNNIFTKLSIMITIPKMSLILILLYYLFLILYKNNKKFFIVLLVILTINKLYYKLDNHYYVYFLDVGQGDSTIFISPHQKEVIMVDTGGKTEYKKDAWAKSNKTYKISDTTIQFLKSIGINTIDYLILSHGDEDHAKEAPNIIKKLKVKNVVLNEGNYNAVEEKIINTGVNISPNIYLKDFQVLSLKHKLYDNENDNSIINYITFNNFSFLLLGDASKKVEEEVLSKYNFEFQFLKIGHHGSKTSTSSTLLQKDFLLAFIMSGRNNRFNHPSKETIDALEKHNKKYYNTQERGTIELKFSNNTYNIFFYEP